MDTAANRIEFGHHVWPANPAQLAPIRAEVRRWLAALVLSDDTEGDVVLAVSEAASNAVEHAYRSVTTDDMVELTFWVESRTFSIEVVDHGVWQHPVDSRNGRGRGIELMNKLVQFVMIHYDIRGTRVLLRHPCRKPSSAPIVSPA